MRHVISVSGLLFFLTIKIELCVLDLSYHKCISLYQWQKKCTYGKHNRRQFPLQWVDWINCYDRDIHSNHDIYNHSYKYAFHCIYSGLSVSAHSIFCIDAMIPRRYSHSLCLNWLATHQLLVFVCVCDAYSALACHQGRHSGPHTTIHWRSVLVTTITKWRHKVTRGNWINSCWSIYISVYM